MGETANLLDDIAADLITTNEIGDGLRDYREVDGVLYMDLYDDDGAFDQNGLPIPSRTFRIDVTLTDVGEG